jgi:hypothetical protein
MTNLDLRTLQRLAKLIIDREGPFERTGRQLEQLLRVCGWTDAPDYDGSPKEPWLMEALQSRDDRSSDIERLVCRICHPVEYDDGRASSEVVRAHVNALLEPERLTVTLLEGLPVLTALSGADGAPLPGAPDHLEDRLPVLISDKTMVELLLGRIREVQLCQAGGAYLLALIGLGSFVEGLLLTFLQEHDPDIRRNGFVNEKGRRMDPSFVGLAKLLDVAHTGDWIQLDAKHFVDRVRDYRNFVHPRKQAETGLVPDADTLLMCWTPITAILNDVEASLGRARRGTP